MTPEDNKAIIRRYLETWNRGDLPGLFEFWSPRLVHHTRLASYGYDETRQLVTNFTNLFAGMQFHVHDMIAEGDRVASRMTWRGTHAGGLIPGLPARGEITCAVLGVARLDDGRIVEHWGVTDELHMVEQLGLVPREFLYALELNPAGSSASTVDTHS
jgi:predicted ester cyclase